LTVSPPLIEVVGLKKSYPSAAGEVPVLKGLDVSIMSGEFVAVMGPSGSGKSTFMNILGCLDVPSAGDYRLQGQPVGELGADALADLRNRVIGFVFQGFNLLPRANLEENVALPLVYARTPREIRLARARGLLDRVGLSAHTQKFPNQLSGGQQQRVAIARALANHPRLILADEPTGNLDSATSREIMALLSELNQNEGLTIVLVTHEPDIAAHAHRLIKLRDGKMAFDGPMSEQGAAL
jgi:putative ABC transport system ATP-binding protein